MLRIGRRWAAPAAAALLIDAVLLGVLLFAEPRRPPAPGDRVVELSLVSARRTPAPRPSHRAAHAASPKPSPRTPNAPPVAAPAPPQPLPLPPASAPPSSRWTVDTSSPGAVRDTPSVERSRLERDACAKGELWKLSTELRQRCLDRWGRFKPSEEEARLHGPALRDPHGDFARAAAAAEDRRHPMLQPPVHTCTTSGSGMQTRC